MGGVCVPGGEGGPSNFIFPSKCLSCISNFIGSYTWRDFCFQLIREVASSLVVKCEENVPDGTWADERNDSSSPMPFMGQNVQNVPKKSKKENIFLQMPEFQRSPYAVSYLPLAKQGERTLYSKS